MKLSLARASLFTLLAVGTGCSVGQGSGDVKSDHLFAHNCWGTQTGPDTAIGDRYDLRPDFFAAVPFRSTLQIRIQRGTDLTEVSDGLSVLIDDVCRIRAALGKDCISGTTIVATDAGTSTSDAGASTGDAGVSVADAGAPSADAGTSTVDGGADAGAPTTARFRVALQAGVRPPGSPITVTPDMIADPPIVHMSLYLQRSCHNQNIVLYGLDGWITFTELFDGNPNERVGEEKLSKASFDVQFGDMADVPLGKPATDVPIGLQSTVTGDFNFYFERGQPGQPFP